MHRLPSYTFDVSGQYYVRSTPEKANLDSYMQRDVRRRAVITTSTLLRKKDTHTPASEIHTLVVLLGQ